MAGAPTVFVSYKREHGETLPVLAELLPALELAGFRVLYDREIEPGQPWPDQLWRWLMECSAAVVLVTDEAGTSDWCRREWSVLAARRAVAGLRVIPLHIGAPGPGANILDRLQAVPAGPGAIERVVGLLEGVKAAPPSRADYLSAHRAWLQWQFTGGRVLGREPFSLADVYIDTECGVLPWRELSGDRPVDPFDEEDGGRRPLTEVVLDLFGQPDFRDVVVVQGPAGSGKSAFTLRLATRLADEGLDPVLVRFRDLRLSTYARVDELLQDAIRIAPVGEHPPPPAEPLFDAAALGRTTRLGAAQISRTVVILDGWDEVSLTGSASYRDQLAEWLPKLREYFTERPGPPVRLLLTGRPSPELHTSRVLRRDTPVLTLRPMRPDQLRAYAGSISRRLSGADWHLDLSRCETAFARYEEWFERRTGDGLDVLGSPLLAFLAFRTMASWRGNVDVLFEHSAALYRALIDITVAHAGKAADSPENAVHRPGRTLRRLLQRVATVMTTVGSEAVSFRELELRLGEDEAVEAWVDDATAGNPLHELVVNFYFKGHPELGCEFLHKSFREYLHAEAVVAALEAVSEGQEGPLPPLGQDYRQDFPAGTPQHDASRSLAALLSPHWLSREITGHLAWLIGQAIAAEQERWVWIRDLLADVYGWWAEGAHLRPRPVKRRGRPDWEPPLVTELLEDVIPRDEQAVFDPPATFSLDGHLGGALVQLTALVHAATSSPASAGPRPYQANRRDRVAFRPGNGQFRRLAARMDAASTRDGAASLSGALLPRVDLSREDLRGVFLGDCDLGGSDLTDVNARGIWADGVLLADADLTGANLDSANLAGAVLTGANLTGALLAAADLIDADLTGTDLTCCELGEADLSDAKLEGTGPSRQTT